MQLDFFAIFSIIPWWIYLIFILVILFKIVEIKKPKNDNEKESKYQNYKPINKINSDRGSLYNTISKKSNNKYNKINTEEKGAIYENHICKHFGKEGYSIAPFGKDNGVKDYGIDIILKKNKQVLFIQCKDWNIKNKHRIDSKEIQYTRMNVRDFIEKNQVFNMYEWKILYVTSDNILHASAKHKIREYSKEIEHRVISIM